jgi:hypothetical protein
MFSFLFHCDHDIPEKIKRQAKKEENVIMEKVTIDK